jgi:hypothetical protein
MTRGLVVALAAALLAGIADARADDPEDRADVPEAEASDATPFGAAIATPEFQGEDAAALAALERWTVRNGPVSRAAAVGLGDEKTLKNYRTYVAKLRGARRVLFAPGAPSFSRLQQGTVLPDGRFQVTFPNGDSATVTPPTDAELAVNDSASTLQDGLWMPVLEKATGVIMARRGGRSASIPDPTVAIDVPGGPKPVVERFTGRRAGTHQLGERAHRGKVRAALTRMQERRLMAEVLILHRPPARSIPWDHVYAVLDFDPGADVVVLWNPWGTDFHPQGASGPQNGYDRVHGVFRIPFDQFVDFFTVLAIEES